MEEAVPGSWPHQVSLQGPSGHFCGGVLISPDFVLTSGRCASLINDYGFSAVVGVHDISNSNAQRICLKNTVIHPDFNSVTGDNDVALLKLAWSAELDEWTNPACIMEDEIPPETICVATGWGSAAKDVFYYPTKLQQYPIPFKRQCSTEDKGGFQKIAFISPDVFKWVQKLKLLEKLLKTKKSFAHIEEESEAALEMFPPLSLVIIKVDGLLLVFHLQKENVKVTYTFKI